MHAPTHRWAKAALTLAGAAAIGILLSALFRPSPSPDQPELEWDETFKAPSPPNTLQPGTTGKPAFNEELNLQPAASLLNSVRQRRVPIGDAVARLAGAGPASVPLVLPAADDPNPAVRLVAIRVLAAVAPRLEQPTTLLVPALARRLRDPEGEIRYAAVVALMNFSDSCENVIPDLIIALADTNGLSEVDAVCIQQSAAHILGKLGVRAQAAVPELARILHDESAKAREAAGTALWRITCDTNLVLPQLQKMLAGTNWSARLEATAVLQQINRDVELSAWLMAEVRAAKAGVPPATP